MRERRVPIARPGNSRTGYVSQRLRRGGFAHSVSVP
jgi:hypothetical protein